MRSSSFNVVCVKVIDDLKVTYEQLRTENPGKNEQEVAELAVTKQCGKKLNRKDNKLVRRCPVELFRFKKVAQKKLTQCVHYRIRIH